MEPSRDLDIENTEQLIQYLRSKGHIAADETPSARNLRGGVSSRTVWLDRQDGTAWVLKQSLEKLRVKVDWFSDPQRVHCEAECARWLEQLVPGHSPALQWEDHEHHVIALDAVPLPHENWKTRLLRGDLDLKHAAECGRLLATIHRETHRRLPEVAAAFAGCNFFESLRVEPYYRYTATQVPEAQPFIASLIESVLSHRLSLVYGDYSPKNMLVYEDRLILLDYETAHIGDPAFDLGFSTTHFLSKAHHLPQVRRLFSAGAHTYWQTYREVLGDLPWRAELEARAVHNTLGCLLGRVAGRSPLEYFDDAERARQRRVVVDLMRDTPATMPALIDEFVGRIDAIDPRGVGQ